MKVEVYDLKLCSRTATNLCLWNERYHWLDPARCSKTKDFSMNLKRLLSAFDLPETSHFFIRKTIKLMRTPSSERVAKLFVAACDLWLPVFDLLEVGSRLGMAPISETLMTPFTAAFGIALTVISARDIPRQIQALCGQNTAAINRVIAFLNLVADTAHTALGALFFLSTITLVASTTILGTVTIGLAANLSTYALKKFRDATQETKPPPEKKLVA